MPIYPYECESCGHTYEVVKSVRDINNVEHCEKCNSLTKRRIALRQSIDKTAASDWDRMEYNPGLGKALTPMQARKEAKSKGLVEIGTEPVEKIHKHFDKVRADNERRKYSF